MAKVSKFKIFDENEFKIYNALSVLEGAKSKIEKARILKDILNG